MNAPSQLTAVKPIHISARGKHDFTPEPLKTLEPKPTFYFWIPTFQQRDSLAQLIFKHGVMPVTVEHGRAVLLSELYEVFGAKDPTSGALPPGVKREGDPDEIASFLEGYWQRADIYDQLLNQWALQEKERLLDQIHSGKKKGEAAPMPAAPFTPRETARAKRLAMDMLDLSESYRDLQARYADYNEREDLALFQLFSAGWVGFNTEPVFTEGGPLEPQCVEDLREELERLEIDVAGKQKRNPIENHFYLAAVQELRSLMTIDRETEKNFVSPLGQGSSPNGLDARSGGSDNGDGPWTGLNTEPTPRSGSRRTSATSSTSQSGPKTRSRKSGRTAPA